MIFTAENTTAYNGMRINSTVELVEGEDKTYWRATVRVDSAPLHRSHHDTRREANVKRETMHRAYVETIAL